jgi:hypothetical protein
MPIAQIDVWVNAYIPQNVGGSLTVGAGSYTGKKAIGGPTGSLFLTDNRGADSNPSASSRMHALLSINCANFGDNPRFTARCDFTIELDSANGSEVCNKQAKTNRIIYRNYEVQCADANRNLIIKWEFSGAASNSCFTLAPDIDWDIKVDLRLNEDHTGATVTVNGLVEPFPAFEMYTKADGQTAKQLFSVDPNPGATPFNLIGWPNKKVSGSVNL